MYLVNFLYTINFIYLLLRKLFTFDTIRFDTHSVSLEIKFKQFDRFSA